MLLHLAAQVYPSGIPEKWKGARLQADCYQTWHEMLETGAGKVVERG